MPVDLEVQWDFYRGVYCRMKTQEGWAKRRARDFHRHCYQSLTCILGYDGTYRQTASESSPAAPEPGSTPFSSYESGNKQKMTTTNMPHVTDYSDTYYVEENTHAYHESTSARYDPQKASCTYPIPTETYSNARGVTASTPFNRKKEVTKEQGVWHIYSYPAVCCDS